MAPKRNLFLHLSALSDTEFATYVEALQDIMDADDGDGGKPMLSDEEFEGRRVSIPVVRAWMKGRFRDLGSAEIDKVLQLFASLTPQKEMSGGQLLAALRLLMHARHGQEICEGNVFVQADPSSPATSRISPSSSSARTMVRTDFPTTDAPPSPPKTVPANLNPFFQRTRPPIPPPTDLSTDPRRASLSSASGLPPISSKPRVDGIGVPPGSTNPFLQRAKTHSGTYEPNPSGSGRTPPLPPRKPSHISSLNAFPKPPPVPAKLVHSVPPRQPNSSASVSSSSNSPPNAPSPSAHFVTPLMQQSLLASRVGASLKRAQDEAERTRVLEVIRSSADSSVSRDRTKSPSRSPDKGTRRPVPRPPRKPTISSAKSDSGAPSEASLAEVASARLTARSRIKPTSPDRISINSSSSSENENENEGAKTPSKGRQLSTSEQFSPPPTHPARRPSARSSSSRGRHVRSPSYQWHGSNYPSSAATSPFTKSSSAPGSHDKQSSSPSPSPSPVSPVNSRPTRSQSMHQPSSPSDLTNTSVSLLPPPRRKRPESAQFPTRPRVLDTDHDVSGDLDPSSPFSNSFGVQQQQSRAGGGGIVNSMAARFDKVSFQLGRESEPERERERDKGEKHKDTFVSLQRTFSALQQRAEPAITRARFKAEAGILAPRRGFVPNGRDYHMAGEDGDRLVNQSDSEGNGGGMDFGASTDQDYEEEDVSGDETIRFRGRSRSERTKKPVFERDDLKLPEGEGWTKL
ncbi:uncharacterized protein FOMMEDRAFT_21224 [Fomitiporia mediterranea MF3/22]|uniref:uncharacterized protein n=1 Tax=Fomitiporia mediterranea (strain MF3/22) TaxID=694068 RepID=UPI000440764B|nr:uncharacterized protein FOMMEDRAFT_21224 [Fomitiporia mediterranea MF3/22]EJD02526.1 hypothetical protein FOMMEDRAFT_21224 [Fomitiporia mediterranea MF3/22]